MRQESRYWRIQLGRWETYFRDNDSDIPVRGSSNYESDEAKKIACFKRELRDAILDALDVIKNRHFGKRLTEAIYVKVSTKVEASKFTRRCVPTSGMLKFYACAALNTELFLIGKFLLPNSAKKLFGKKSRRFMENPSRLSEFLKSLRNFESPAKIIF